MRPAVMKLLVVFSRRAWEGSEPTLITVRAITFSRKGRTSSIAEGGPATATSRRPATARGVAPKTGVAI